MENRERNSAGHPLTLVNNSLQSSGTCWKSPKCETLTSLNSYNIVPARKASGVYPQIGFDLFHQELCQLPDESALRDKEYERDNE